jgi:catechol 2,3-dioxygenase-like lactoylglutathione lyase family enzyme
MSTDKDDSVESPETPASGPIVEALIVTPDLDRSIQLYREGLGWVLRGSIISGPVVTPLGPVGIRSVRLGPRVGAASPAGVQLVEDPDCTPIEPLHTHGWGAIEVGVRDVFHATATAAAAGWRVLFEPVTLGAGKLPLIASQLAGPGGEGLYLTQILGDVPGFELPNVVHDVDGIFIVTLGASNLEKSRAVIESQFLARRVSDRELPIGVVNRQHGLPLDTLHRLSSVQLSGRTCIEVDQLPSQTDARPFPNSGGILAVVVQTTLVDFEEWVTLPDDVLWRSVPAGARR